MKNIVCIIAVFIFSSCDSEPVKATPKGGVEFEQHIFELSNVLNSNQDDFSNINRGRSSLLFSGIINDTLKVQNSEFIIKDTSYALLSLDLSKFSSYVFCDSVVQTYSPKVLLSSSTQLTNIPLLEDKLKIKLLSNNVYNQEDMIWSGSNNPFEIIEDNQIVGELNYDISENSDNKLIVTLPEDSFINDNFPAIICESSIVLLIEYFPDEVDNIKIIHWYSSEGLSPPAVEFDYINTSIIDTSEYQFTIEGYTSENKYYYVEDPLNENWSTTYFINIQDSISKQIDSLDFNGIIVDSPLINSSSISTKINLGVLKIKLNDNPIAQDSISTILLALDDVIAYIDDNDPSMDNYDGEDTLLTQGNNQYDILYSANGSILKKEKFNDFGIDNCENKYEKGDMQCCENNIECVYNNQGSENNNILNEGEQWEDIGSDGCSDEYEIGDPDNPECSELPNPDYITGSDPHGDNYNIDPEGDDYSTSNLEGMENNGELDWIDDNNNGQWDDGEGEIWFDYGLDGLPNTYDSEFENDGEYQSFEIFFDYGQDNISNENESGFCDDDDCTENNDFYDSGELVSENDVGLDGCSDEYEIGNPDNPVCSSSINPNYVIGDDPHSDNYNVDPNQDNYNSDTKLGTEGNGELDWTDNDNGQWDDGEGERWYDYGLDQTQDEYEQYLSDNQIIISLGLNDYSIDVSDDFYEYFNNDIPAIGDNGVAVWISAITYDSSEQTYHLTISLYSNKTLDGVKFSLNHPDDEKNLKVSWKEEYDRHYIEKYSSIDSEDSTIQIFDDISLYPMHSADEYLTIIPDSLFLVNYAYDIYSKVYSNQLQSFIDNYSNDAVSLEFSSLVIPVDSSLNNDISGQSRINLDLISDNLINNYISSSDYVNTLPYGYIDNQDSYLEINIGNLIQYHIVNDIPFEGFILSPDDNFNNFESLYFNKNDSYIRLVMQK